MTDLRFRLSTAERRHIIVTSLINALSLVVVGLRIYSRKFTGAGVGWDDIFIVAAAVLGNLLLILFGYSCSVVPEIHQYMAEKMGLLQPFLYFFFVSHTLFLLCICFIKLSVLSFYLRVFAAEGRLRTLCRGLAAVFVLWSAANIVALLNICRPLASFWGPLHDRACARQEAVDVSICVFNAASDLLLVALPMPAIWRLQMRRGLKVKLAAVLSLGVVVTVIAILRLEALLETDWEGDVTGTAERAMFLSVLEPNLAILCASLPMLQPLCGGLLCGRSRTRAGDVELRNTDGSRPSPARDTIDKSGKDSYDDLEASGASF
ncbi:hypothetical protein DL766_008348 [Monosporascus sp. MC13-8B]|uniref:Rhodopsin domain-containing protein n=1 Tax=Monosporascus cannonballus TaxID=155416 RepID=A0ABY0H3Z9_9PEZI|nr:hypothetical protein DL762_005861 [Monosporascus cannonballus]RYO87136.1 hypothetical protein DL763_006490 [Monosporascus cannonballus]RYP19784.1 hypothetical protein DL766_008348 [Monosporascus sp. MC13-8B]